MSTSESSPTHLPWQPYARVDLSPMPGSTLSPIQGLWFWPLERLKFKLMMANLLFRDPETLKASVDVALFALHYQEVLNQGKTHTNK
jgi:hypothetical protein